MAAIFEVFWPPWGVKMHSQTVPGGVKIAPWRVPRGSWRPLSSSGGLLGIAAGVLEGSGSRLAGPLVPNGTHFGTLFGSLFGIHFDTDFGLCFLLIWLHFGNHFGVVF